MNTHWYNTNFCVMRLLYFFRVSLLWSHKGFDQIRLIRWGFCPVEIYLIKCCKAEQKKYVYCFCGCRLNIMSTCHIVQLVKWQWFSYAEQRRLDLNVLESIDGVLKNMEKHVIMCCKIVADRYAKIAFPFIDISMKRSSEWSALWVCVIHIKANTSQCADYKSGYF